MNDTFCRITRCTANHNGRLRLTEIRVAGYYTNADIERIRACCGKSVSYAAARQKGATSKAA